MAETEVIVAITALAVSAVALLIATGQILGQYYNTADGYRRCQYAVIGPWSQMTRRRFIWSQLRFEVLYTTPFIALASELTIRPIGFKSISSAPRNRQEVQAAQTQRIPFKASWVLFVDKLRRLQELSVSSLDPTRRDARRDARTALPARAPPEHHNLVEPTVPCYVEVEMSWDFMPPDLLRPVAPIALGDLIVLAHRLGLSWRELRPAAGELHAEGNNQTMIASMARSFGIVLHYLRDEVFERRNRKNLRETLLIPTIAADKLGFGIITGTLGIPELALQSQSALPGEEMDFSEVADSLDLIGVWPESREFIRKIWKEEQALPGVGDILAVASPFLPVKHSSIVKALDPMSAEDRVLASKQGREAFRNQLHIAITQLPNDPRLELKERVRDIIARWTRGEEMRTELSLGEEELDGDNHKVFEYLDYLRAQHNFTHDYFEHLMHQLPYKVLVSTHISNAIWIVENHAGYCFGPERMLRNQVDKGIFEDYVRKLPDLVKDIMGHGESKLDNQADEDEIIYAWWVMMFRGLCWHRSVNLVRNRDRTQDRKQGMIIQSSLWGSQIPVYIS
ncbi:hypothetical protein ACHAPJ_010167 [Fusarium lateritium]